MEDKVKFVVVLVICLALVGVTIFVYQGKYGNISLSGFAINQSVNGEVNWPLIALIAQWFLLGLAVIIAGIHYLNPYKSRY